ncbi:MAG: hypothetical protein MZV70_35860 [Desulfobacterales bacterium]|nr:hypothetical protein [Desulfobacterales bacterium]
MIPSYLIGILTTNFAPPRGDFFDGDSAAEAGNDTVGNGQAEAGTAFLGGEKGLEDSISQLIAYSGTIVFNDEDKLLFLIHKGQADRRLGCFDGILDDIQDGDLEEGPCWPE